MENGKLIVSRNVQFNENDTPSELTSIDLPKLSPDDINQLVDNAISNSESKSESLDPTSTNIEVEYSSTLPMSTLSQFDPINLLPAPKKSNKLSKWDNLPCCKYSSRQYNLIRQ